MIVNKYDRAKIPVLLYHALFEGKANAEKYAIPADTFDQHIRYLAEEGFETLSFDAFLAGSRLPSEKRRIMITFDDGNDSDHSIAFQTLRKYGFVGTFFVTVGRIGTRDYLGWEHLKEMMDGGMSVQSHSVNHLALSDLSNDGLNKELAGSKKILEDKLSHPVDFMSLPGGFYSRRVLKAAQRAGYKGVATSRPGPNRLESPNGKFKLYRRFVITRKTSMDHFQEIVQARWLSNAKSDAVYQLKWIGQKALGSRRYSVIWSKYFKYER